MTTPPDTPKPPAEVWVSTYTGGPVQYVYEKPPGDRPSHHYILAPSPQESHKLAEELERLAVEFRFCSTDLGNAFALARFASDNALALLAALRSSPSEQDARELSDDLKMIDDTL